MSTKIESEMLKDFIDELNHRQQKYYEGQGKDNRIEVNDKVSFQFGDLRIYTDKYHKRWNHQLSQILVWYRKG